MLKSINYYYHSGLDAGATCSSLWRSRRELLSDASASNVFGWRRRTQILWGLLGGRCAACTGRPAAAWPPVGIRRRRAWRSFARWWSDAQAQLLPSWSRCWRPGCSGRRTGSWPTSRSAYQWDTCPCGSTAADWPRLSPSRPVWQSRAATRSPWMWSWR